MMMKPLDHYALRQRLIAAGVAFFSMFALFPVGCIAVYGLLADPT
jgi:uncharacterized BrkB/YihY/UPF0761 family membrane protein